MNIPGHNLPADSSRSALTIHQLVLMVALFGMLAVTLEAAQPAWWTTRGAVNSSLTRNDSLALQESQLKKMTFEAVQEMNAHLSGGAGTTLNGMATTWSNNYVAHGFSTNDYQAVKVGQLKYIAYLTYGPLITNGYMAGYPAWLQTNAAVDTHVANLGQLKQAFAFEITTPQSPTNLIVSQGSTSATINWYDPVISVQTFTIQGSADGGTTWVNLATISGSTNAGTATSLTLGTNYIFRVTATNPSGTSAPSTTDAAPIISLLTPTGATLVP